MNNIYVDELPKDCSECPMCRSGNLKLQKKGRYIEAKQCVFGQYKYQTIDDEIDTCPLKSLTAHDKLKDLDYDILKRDYDFLRKEYNRLIDVVNHRFAEERKMVVQELKKRMPIFFGKKGFDWEGFNDYLDQLERGE